MAIAAAYTATRIHMAGGKFATGNWQDFAFSLALHHYLSLSLVFMPGCGRGKRNVSKRIKPNGDNLFSYENFPIRIITKDNTIDWIVMSLIFNFRDFWR